MEAMIFVLFSCCVVFCTGYTDLPQCGRDEVVSCVQDCPPERTCRTRGIQFNCLQSQKPCRQKCVCKPDYYRNAIGDCITNEQCDQCQKSNEFFNCGTACDNVCSDPTQNRTNCNIVNIVCNPKCYCEDGFARNLQSECVPIENCPKTKKCGPNEEFVACKRTCPPEHCISLVAKFKCPEDQGSMPGCACKPGYLRKDENSTCVPICECPQMANSSDSDICGPNEEFISCKRTCPPEICFAIIAFYDCSREQACEPGCACKPGHYRKHENSTCVPSCECPQLENSDECVKAQKT